MGTGASGDTHASSWVGARKRKPAKYIPPRFWDLTRRAQPWLGCQFIHYDSEMFDPSSSRRPDQSAPRARGKKKFQVDTTTKVHCKDVPLMRFPRVQQFVRVNLPRIGKPRWVQVGELRFLGKWGVTGIWGPRVTQFKLVYSQEEVLQLRHVVRPYCQCRWISDAWKVNETESHIFPIRILY